MNKRYEDLSDDELRALADDIDAKLDPINGDDEAAAGLIEQESLLRREICRREALETRKAGGYSVTLVADGQEIEYELRATNEADAKAETESGIVAMSKVSGLNVTIKHINGPLGGGE
ncbi:hypothetical protein DFO67_12629 [Modicisalibacter xianhensis]|uniref:Uncharacterized protein n=1 Tax=Modicisalibacter xianhensis TaxID=442341 RepID=A0A4R8FBI2_9GAMM|nr:hypothetical protein [Halomonas xianhensis]TDX22959.1 hypothetical protein DFO67_12629 [Halomonas xianhensis]